MSYHFYKLPTNLCITLIIMLCGTLSCGRKSEINDRISYNQRIEQLINECYQEYPDVPWISLEDFLHQGKHTKWVIVDVRSRREQDVSIIPGALNIDEFESQLSLFKESPVLVYCTAGCRSGGYTKVLNQKGVKAFNLRGGVLTWALEGKSFITSSGETTHKAHVYGKKWDALPPGYESVW